MTAWTSDELKRIAASEEIRIASLRQDGTLRAPVTIWVVRVDDGVYVRAYKGRTSPWFRGVQSLHQGQMRAGGVAKEIDFIEETDANINDQIDTAYLTKYRRYPTHVAPMVTAEARAATIKLVPRSDLS